MADNVWLRRVNQIDPSEETAYHRRANWSGTEKGYTLDEYRTEYAGEEAHSLAIAPQLEGVEPDWRPPTDSPLIGAGDPSVYDSLGLDLTFSYSASSGSWGGYYADDPDLFGNQSEDSIAGDLTRRGLQLSALAGLTLHL